MKPIKIIDIIHHKNKYGIQQFVVTDRQPEFLYDRKNGWLIGEDSGFFNFYFLQPPTKYAKAFAGREFKIPLKDGTEIEAKGQWWDGIPEDYCGLLASLGVGTPETLSKCNVFSGVCLDPDLIEGWLEKNEPTNNYSKYDSRNKDYGKQTIESRWE
jgi:hypothetical protein